MSSQFRSRVAALASVLALPIVPAMAAQEKAATKPAAASAPATAGQAKANLSEEVATVGGQPITKRELVKLLSQFQIPPGSEQRAFDSGIELLVNTKLLEQFLNKANLNVSKADVEKTISQERARLEQQGGSLEKALAETNTTVDELRAEIERSLKWRSYVTEKATDAELQDFLKKHADVFSGTLVKASHILLKADPKATAEDKQKIQQKLAAIKQEIESKKISFADAANKYSEDDGNVAQPSGGDLGLFPRRGQFIEPFAKAAFAMKKGEISDPIETEYGQHLIYVTDRKEGQTLDFDKIKNDVLNQYAADLQTEIVEAERKGAKIDVKPMPSDLFRLVQDGAAAAAAANRPAQGTGGGTPAKKATAPAGR